jgi:7-cyano-7-deazaguanine synthase
MKARDGRGGAVVLLSGGMDSATSLAVARRDEPGPLRTLTLSYGQRHVRELRSARALARHFSVSEALELTVPFAPLAPSAITGKGALPRDRSTRTMGQGIPSTYVPGRNTVFLALALSLAESRRSEAIYLGINAVDYSGYPDCRPEYLRAFQRLASLATARGVEEHWTPRLVAPLLRLSKEEIVRLGERLQVPWEKTWSCYAGGARPCGRCDACRLRALGFRKAGVADPLVRTRS